MNTVKRLVILLVTASLLLSACSSGLKPVAPVEGMPQGTGGGEWWNDSVFYELFVRSFYDSDGDGIGDFNGVIEKLDYLNDGDPKTTTDLGITALWLMPIFPSPSYHGYDVTNYYDVNPDYGTMDDFKRLMDEAHERGIRVIIDMVLNHTSSKHPWFQSASVDAESEYRDWYVFSDTDPAFVGPWDQKVWHKTLTGYYYGVFWDGMPDLNLTNPEVVTEMQKVARFWLEDVGVDGFRLDGARHIIEEGTEQSSTASTHEFWKEYRTFVKSVNPEAVLVGEVWTSNYDVKAYLQGDEFDLAFNFDQADSFLRAVIDERAAKAFDGIKLSVRLFEPTRYGTFLTNHDINRVMSEIGGDVERAKAAAALMLTAPGVPFIYYGEEIGLKGAKPDEKIRTPMPWTDEKNGGFTTSTPWEPFNADYKNSTVAGQTDDPNSLLSTYRALIGLRNQYAALRIGEYLPMTSTSKSVFAALRVYEGEVVLVIINVGEEAVTDYALSIKESPISNGRPFLLYGSGEPENLTPGENGSIDAYQPLPELPAFGVLILGFSGD